MNVMKRNGDVVPFDRKKIVTAINSAFVDVDGQIYETDTANDIAYDIERDFEFIQSQVKTHIPSVEQIQDAVEDYLMRSERRDVARAYIRHRY